MSRDTASAAAQDVAARVGRGGGASADELLPAVYAELRALARSQLSRLPPGQTLQATALVHEAWIRVAGRGAASWDSRAHFYGAAARAMRNILVDRARRKARLRHGGGWGRAEAAELGALAEAVEPRGVSPEERIALDDALRLLERASPAHAEVCLLRFYCGLGLAEIGRVLGLPRKRVERGWRFARAWLQREIDGAVGGRGGGGAAAP